MNHILTQAMCFAAGRDAGNRSMRKAGRTVWAQADYNAACAEYKRLLPFANCNYTVGAANYELKKRGDKGVQSAG